MEAAPQRETIFEVWDGIGRAYEEGISAGPIDPTLPLPDDGSHFRIVVPDRWLQPFGGDRQKFARYIGKAISTHDDYLFTYSAEPDGLERFLIKRRAFECENEMRALVIDGEAGANGKSGVFLAADLNVRITALVVSPYAPAWLLPVVKDVAQKFGVTAEVRPSALTGEPFYF